jgi:ABC-type branched-subunit amino acid transport system ATPase component
MIRACARFIWAMRTLMLEVRDLHARYGDSYGLFGLSLKVSAGAGVALLGRNGAGKSTLLKAVMDAGPSCRGEILLQGRSLAGLPTEARARLGLTLVPEDRRIFTNLTVRQNLELAHHALSRGRKAISVDEMGRLFPVLPGLLDRLGYQLSGGQQQLVAVEPAEGLAPKLAMDLAQEVRRARQQLGLTVLVAEQNVAYARQCTEYVYLLDSGNLVFEGDWAAFDAHPELKTRYLAV